MKNRIVLITGANSGIGEQAAYKFAQNGDLVLITYFQEEEKAKEVAEKCRNFGAKEAEYFFLDLKDNRSIEELARQVGEKFGGIDILINNAGAKVGSFLEKQDFLEIEEQIRVNLEGLIKLTSLLVPYVRQSIVNIGSSIVLSNGKRELSVYAAAKYGVRGFTKSLAREYPSLKVFVVNPGLTATKMMHFRGVDPSKPAIIIWRAAIGFYRAKSGSDINVRDYRFNSFIRFFLPVLRFIKRVISF